MKTLEIRIPFLVYENENSFIKIDENRIETVSVNYFQSDDNKTIYKVKFKDIGLDSKFGEIEIVNRKGFWELMDNSNQRNLIINKIIEQLILQNI